MNALPAKTDGNVASAIHLEFIRMVADGNRGAGVDEVEAFHRALFLHHHGKDLERWQEERRIREDRLGSLERRLAQIRDRLASEEKFVPVLEDGQPDTQPSSPWNLWDRSMFVVGALAIACLLVFGVFNVSFNLLESGIITFSEHPIRAYFWAALLPVGALAVKVGWDLLPRGRLRSGYLWTCLGVGFAALLAWVAAYSSVYPTLSKTTADQIASLSVFDKADQPGDYLSRLTSGGVKRVDMILVAAQALAEICLSAALGIYLTQLYSRHRPVRLAHNPAFVQVDQERINLEQTVSRDRLALADAKGEESRLQNQLTVFIAYARSLFEKEVNLRRDRSHQKRILLDEIAEELRERLAAVDREPQGEAGNGRVGDAAPSVPSLESAGNGSR